MNKQSNHLKHFRAAQILFLFGLTAAAAFAQSGDVDTSAISTLGSTLLKLFIGLAGMCFVGLVVWGGITLSTNRPKGLAMIGGGLVGALVAGLSFLWVNHLTGGSTSVTGFLLIPKLLKLA